MPRWQVQSPDGALMEIEGDTMPTEADLDQIFSPAPKAPEQPPVPRIPDATPSAPGLNIPPVDAFGGEVSPKVTALAPWLAPPPIDQFPSMRGKMADVEESAAPPPVNQAERIFASMNAPEQLRQAPAPKPIPEPGEEGVGMEIPQAKSDWLKSQFGQQDLSDEEFLEAHPNLKFAMYGFMSPTDMPMGRLSTEDAKRLGMGKLSGVVSGAQNSVADLVDFMTSAPGVMTAITGGAMGTGAGLGAAGQRAIAYAYAADMARQSPEQFGQIVDALANDDPQTATRGILNLAVTIGVVKHGAQLAVTPEGIIPKGMFERGQWQGPYDTGARIPQPAPRGVPTSVGTTALPGIAERTVADLGGPQEELPGGPLPVRPSRQPVIPGAEQPRGVPEPGPTQGPAAPPAAWEDFVADTRRRGSPDMTIAQIQALWPDQKLNREAARRLRDDAFGPSGGASEVPPVAATAPTPPPEPPVTATAELPSIEEMQSRADRAEVTHTGRVNGRDSFRFTDPTSEPGKPSQITFSVPAGSDFEAIKEARKFALIRTRVGDGVPDETIQLMINKLEAPFEKRSFVQVDEIHPTKGDLWSANPELANRAGLKMPTSEELFKLPNGKYTLPEAIEKLNALEAETKPKAPIKRGNISARVRFYNETARFGNDVLSFIEDEMPLMSKSAARRELSPDNWRRNKGDWDDAPDRLAGVHHNVIYARGGGSRPDQVAQEAYNRHLISDPTPSALWAEIARASKARMGNVASGGAEEAMLQREAAELTNWQDATKQAEGKKVVSGDQLKRGDVLVINGERVPVAKIDPDSEAAIIRGGNKYGHQAIEKGQQIWVDNIEEAPADEGFLPEGDEPPAPQKPKVPFRNDQFNRALSMESVGGNAGKGRAAVNFLFDATGDVVFWGNWQNAPEVIKNALMSGELQTGHVLVKDALSNRPIIESVSKNAPAEIQKLIGNPVDIRGIPKPGALPPPHPLMDEIGRLWPQLSPAEADIFGHAIDAARAKLKDYSTPAEALQKEALRIGAPREGIKLTRIGDLKLAKQIADKYLKPEAVDPDDMAFGDRRRGRFVDFPSRTAAEEWIAKQQGRPGASNYLTRIVKEAEDNYSVIYEKRPNLKNGSKGEQINRLIQAIDAAKTPEGVDNAERMYRQMVEDNIFTPADEDNFANLIEQARKTAKPRAPKLRPGEKGTGDLLQGPDQPFNLTGEKGTDADRIAAEKAAAEKAAAEAKALEAKQQQELPGTKPPKPGEAETQPPISATPPPAPKEPFFKPEQQAKVDDLKAKLRRKLGLEPPEAMGPTPAYSGPAFDPELFNLGSELALEYIKAGVRKFGDFASHMIRDLGDKAKDYLLSWYSNARIQLRDIAHELDSEPDAEAEWNKRFGRRDKSGPEVSGSVRGGGTPGGRPGIRISRKELIPEPRKYVDANSYAKGGHLGLGQRPFILDDEQVRGVNLALDRFIKNPVRAAFVLADGTGFGKTAQLLAIADQYIKRFAQPGKPSPRVLIVTKNKQIAQIRFGGDADAMGIPQKSYTITTYTGLHKIPPGAWDLVMFDEAHNLKNPDALKSIRAQRLDSKHTVFATATPMDKPTGAAYFLSEITGRSEHDIAKDLGYTIVEREDPETHNTYQSAVLLPGFSWPKVWANIMNHRDAAIRDGSLIRREYPFFGKVDVAKLDMTPEDVAEHNQILGHLDALIKAVRSPTAKRNFAGQKTLQLSRWAEQAKIQKAVDMAIDHVEKGGQAIIVAETDKDQSFWQPIRNAIRTEMRTSEETGRTRQVWIAEGAITQMKKMLAARGYTDIADIHDPKSNDIRLQVREFQAGRKRIALATPASGGTGIDLDDQTGNRPRLMVALSKNMAGDDFEQLVGRVSRKNTQSPAQVTFLDLAGAFGDMRREKILATKIRTLKAIQGGEDIDVAARERQAGEGPTRGPGGELYSGLPIPAVLRSMRYVANDIGRIYDEVTSSLGFRQGNPVALAWKHFSMQSLPRITEDNRPAGEAGVRYAVSPMVARAKGLMFAENVTQGVRDPDFDHKFGTGLTEDNLRDLKRQWNEKADEAEDRHEIIDSLRDQISDQKDAADDGDPDAIQAINNMRKEIRRLSKLTDEDAAIFRDRADKVTTMVGAPNSPFANEVAYRAFMDSPETQQAIARHIERWRTEKDPLYREAADIDPQIEELPTRGLDYGARVNLKDIGREQPTPTAVGGAHAPKSRFINPRATLRRTDPFAQAAMGAGTYEGSYKEIMANGFGREYPVAKQHEFIRQLVRGGDAKITMNAREPELELKNEPTQPYPLTRGPWKGKTLHVRKSLAHEYEDASGLSSQYTIPVYTKVGEFLTRMSVQGLAEGSTHVSNLLSQVFTGLGPTSDPLFNTLLKTMGRSDLLVSLPKVFINAFANRKADMLKLAEIGAAKEPYRGTVGWFITKIDQGVRLYAADVYKGMAAKGWVPDTETGLREFVNQVGQYNKRLQPRTIQLLRSTGVQPFATAVQTFNVAGLRTLAAGPGAKGASNLAATALRADKAASILGFAVVVGGLNYLLSGSVSGPPGTRLGEVGWKDDKGQTQKIDVGALTGISRGARITGLQGFVESKRSGLDTGAAMMAGSQGVARAGLSYFTGPMNRFAFMGATGKRPDVPMTASQFQRMQEAKVVPPQKEQDFSPLKTQMAANILEATKQANPLVDFATRATRGQYEEAARRQFQRYYPRTGSSEETIKNLPKIVQAGELNAYVDALATDARKQPRGHLRNEFINERMKEDKLDSALRRQAMDRLRREGVFSH